MTAQTANVAAVMLVRDLIHRYPDEAAREVDLFTPPDVIDLLEELHAPQAALVLQRLRLDLASQVLEQASSDLLRRVLPGMEPARAAASLARLGEGSRSRVLEALESRTARELRGLMDYPPLTAGSLMDPRIVIVTPQTPVAVAIDRIRSLGEGRLQQLYVVDHQGQYVGVVALQDLVTADPDEGIDSIIRAMVPAVPATAPQSEVVEQIERLQAPALPVVDFEGRLLGTIRHQALVTAVAREASSDIQTMVGVSHDERARSGVGFAVRRRLPWLQINLLTAFLAAFVVGLFEDTIARFTALAVLLPVVAGQSGNTGAQALAVTMRGLSLREVGTRDTVRIATKEALVGATNGVAVACVTGVAVYAWSRSLPLAGVIGVAMVISMFIAGLAGAGIPMVLHAIGQDPAQSSSIILTTVTDVAGFLSFLGLATLASGML